MFLGTGGRPVGSVKGKRISLTRPRLIVSTKRTSIGKGKPKNVNFGHGHAPPTTATPARLRNNATYVTTAGPGRRGVLLPHIMLAGEGSGGGGGAEVDAATQRGNIKVVVRVRPANGRESGPSRRLVVHAVDSHIVVFDPAEESDEFYFHGVRQNGRDVLKKPNKDKKFAFDNVYGPASTNTEIFEETIKPTIDTILAGFNCSVFAYGATGSGKTYTMVGSNALEEPGLTYLTVMELYKRLQEMEEEYNYEIQISYLEVYNEQVKDLLHPSVAALSLLEDTKGVVIPHLSHHKPEDADHILKLLRAGNARRSQHPTDRNLESSRSHAVFQVNVTLRSRYKGLTNSYRAAKLVMVDLAGSERPTSGSQASQGMRLREGISINQSLLVLGNCINALAEGKKHIPYRNSKLTRILKDALGGKCKTVMIANVSPSDLAYGDSFNTLSYADRAKRIKFNIKKNTMTFNARVGQYKVVVDEMANQIATLQKKIQEFEQECTCKIPKTDATTATEIEDFSYAYQDSKSAKSSLSSTNTTLPFDATYVKPNPVVLRPVHTAASVMQLESYRRCSRLLNEKTDLERQAGALASQMQELDCKLKVKELRMNNAQVFLHNERNKMKGMDLMKKQRNSLAQKKTGFQLRLGKIQEELENVTRELRHAEQGFCYSIEKQENSVQISAGEFLELKKLQARDSAAASASAQQQRQTQTTLTGMYDELVKTDALLYQSLSLLKPTHLAMKNLGQATNADAKKYEELMQSFFCVPRIHFEDEDGEGDGSGGETSPRGKPPALSPYYHWGNVNGASGSGSGANSTAEDDEGEVSSSTSAL